MPWVLISALESKQNVIALSVSNYAPNVDNDKFRKYLNFQHLPARSSPVLCGSPHLFNWTFVSIIEKPGTDIVSQIASDSN